MKPLFLIGYMGCGKSSLGRKLARHLEADFIDTDTRIERTEGAAIADIFRYAGEAYFRQAERNMLDSVIAEGKRVVVATGGGLPAWQDNMTCMNRAGLTVYLKRTAEQIASRLSPYGRQKRPRLRGLSDEELVAFMTSDMASREPFYGQARLVIDCAELSDEELTRIIAARYDAEMKADSE